MAIRVERVCDMASAIRAASWPEVGAVQAVRIAFKFIEVIEKIEELEREMYFRLET